jgi:Ser/Thr protein kinase RdoA (MazF antagonist)
MGMAFLLHRWENHASNDPRGSLAFANAFEKNDPFDSTSEFLLLAARRAGVVAFPRDRFQLSIG